jgi:hypothetical protein
MHATSSKTKNIHIPEGQSQFFLQEIKQNSFAGDKPTNRKKKY